jgi:hypothetical protein
MNDCCCSYPDYDPPEIFSEEIRKARIPHRCGECCGEIKPGEKYEYAHGRREGHWSKHYTCLICKRIRDDLCSCGFLYGQLRDTIWDCLGIDIVTGEMEEDDEEDDDDQDAHLKNR